MLEYAILPSFIPSTIDVKLSSITIKSAVSIATSVPLPIAIPILAVFIAGASLTPSPVTATNSPFLFNDSTIFNLSVGVTLENTLICFMYSSKYCSPFS